MHPMGSRDDEQEIVINWQDGVDVQIEMVTAAALTRTTRQLGPAEIIAALAAATIDEKRP